MGLRCTHGAQLLCNLKGTVLPWLVWLSGLIAKQRVTSLIPSQGICLGFGPGPQ